MANKYTAKILSLPFICITNLEITLKLNPILPRTEFFWDAYATIACGNDPEYKANLCCLFAAMTNEEVEEIRALYLPD